MVVKELKLVQNEPIYWDFIRVVRNDPTIQKGFVEVVEITPAQQASYMSVYNDNYWICLNWDGQPIGYIGEIVDDIRLAVIEEAQRNRVALFMVKELMELRPDSYAKMKHNNIASKQLFEKAGFTYVKMDDKFYYYEKK